MKFDPHDRLSRKQQNRLTRRGTNGARAKSAERRPKDVTADEWASSMRITIGTASAPAMDDINGN